MPLNRFRQVEYMDDGVYEYQCLHCYKTWNTRGSVSGWSDNTRWNFCPFCACQWEGEHKCKEHGEKRHELCRNYKWQTISKQFVRSHWELQRLSVGSFRHPEVTPQNWEYFSHHISYPREKEKEFSNQEQFYRWLMVQTLASAIAEYHREVKQEVEEMGDDAWIFRYEFRLAFIVESETPAVHDGDYGYISYGEHFKEIKGIYQPFGQLDKFPNFE